MAFGNHMRKLVSASDDKSIKVWDLNYNSVSNASQSFTHPREFTCMQFSESDHFLASGHKDGYVRIWSLDSCQKPTHEISAHDSLKVTSIRTFGQGSYILSSGLDNTLAVTDLRKPSSPVARLVDDNLIVNSKTQISVSTHGKYASVCSPSTGKVIIFDLSKE